MNTKHLLVVTAFVSFAAAPLAYGAEPTAPAATVTTAPATAPNPVIARLVTMHLARLAMQQITAIETADQIVHDSEVYAGSYGDVERKQLWTNSNLIAQSYVEYVEYQAENATAWPADQTKDAAKAELAKLKDELKKQPNVEALPILKRANEIFAWTTGKPTITSDIDHFARIDTLVAYAIAHVPNAAKLSDPAPAVASTTTEQPPPLPPTTTTTTTTATTTPGTGPDTTTTTTTQPQNPTNPTDALTSTTTDTTTQTASTTTPTTPTTTTSTDTPAVAPLTTLAARLATIHLIRASIGEENPAQLEESVGAELKTYAAANNPADSVKVRDELKAIATRYVDQIADASKSSTKWPTDKPAATYVGMAALALEMARNEITALNDDTSDLTGPLRRANRVLAWSTGATETPLAMDHFAKHQALVEAALGKALAFEQPKRPQ